MSSPEQHHTTRDQTNCGPIFIVGMNGSGTTMLADCLDNAQELYVFPRETRMIPWLVERRHTFGDLTEKNNLEKLLDQFLNMYAIRFVSKGDVPTIDAVQVTSVYGVIDAVYRHFATKEGKQRWVEKSPMNVQFMLSIAEEMPDARFIHIYRDGRDVAQSNKRRWHKNPIWSIYRWSQIVQQARRDGKQLGATRYFEIRYEDLTQDPEATMQKVANFIDIPYSPTLLRSSMPFVDSVYRNNIKEKSGTLVPNSQKWKIYFSEEEIKELELVGGRLLSELGYPTDHPDSEQVPSALQRKLWRSADVFTQGMLVLRRYRIKRSTPRTMLQRFNEGLKYISVQRH